MTGSVRAAHARYVETTTDPILAARRTVNGLLVSVAGLIAVAVGNELVIAHPHDQTSVALSLVLFGGPLLYLLSQTVYLWAVVGTRSWPRMAGIAALAVAGGASGRSVKRSPTALRPDWPPGGVKRGAEGAGQRTGPSADDQLRRTLPTRSRRPLGARHNPRQTTDSEQCVGPASPWWVTIRKQRPGSGAKASR
jgi:Bacterial low temperature requirement A protein (LtrA)